MVSADGDSTPPDRLIPAIPRSSRPAAAIILACVALYSLAGFLPGGFFGAPLWLVGALGLLVGLATAIRSAAAAHATIFSVLVMIAYRTPGMGIHPFPLLTALAGYGLVVLITPQLRETVFWLHTGSLEAGVRRLLILAIIAPAISLPVWFYVVGPEIRELVVKYDDLPLWALVPIGGTFALVNAACEEAAFRGILMDALVGAVGIATALGVQSAAFGLIHYPHGLPGGTWGAFLTGTYGLLLGLIRVRARGMIAPLIAHAAADLAVFILLVLGAARF